MSANPSEAQQAILLASLRAHLTAASHSRPSAGAFDDDILRSLLAVEDWNVSRAVTLFHQTTGADGGGSGGAAGGRPSVEDDEATARRIQQMEIDDSAVGGSGGMMGETLRAERAPLWPSAAQQQNLYRRAARGPYGGTSSGGGPFGDDDRLQHAGGFRGQPQPNANNGGLVSIWNLLYQTITLPFSIAQSLLLFLLRLLRIRPPGAGGSSRHSGHPSAGSRMTIDARAAAEQYIRELEQDLASSRAGGDGAEGSARSRVPATYPPLFVGSYSQACQRAKEDLKVLAIILTSVDNPDSDTFRRHTLTDSSLVETLSRPDFLVWAGDIREREAWQVAEICDATSFPFIAFVSLQPSRSARGGASTSSSSSPRLAILSRHSGTALVKPSPSLAAGQLHDHLSSLLLPRVRPYLDRLASERARLASERALRAEQDAAFERAAQADVARVRARREAEQQRLEAERRQREEAARVEEERRRVETWRKWARASLVPPERASQGQGQSAEDAVLIQFRLPGGRSLSRSFDLDDELEGVFAYIDTSSLPFADDDEAVAQRPQGYTHQYGFELVLGGYPRRKVSPGEIASSATGAKTRLRDVAGLNDVRRANVIVEGTVLGNSSSAAAGAGGSGPGGSAGAGDEDESSGEESE
ncbi:UBX domain-containing protein 10 [Tilletia horrida]|uniref:UBX domain-containing protein 10 n=1 Tax=Tilletia horrida TaxID=155126 RepID=A0AAN6G9P1_9BASI|nr:UBX domain-containing protein 10 [Tilletia horrida]